MCCFARTESKVGGDGGSHWGWRVSQHFCSQWVLSWWLTPQTVSSSEAAWKKVKLFSERFVAPTTLSLSSWSLSRQVVSLKRLSTPSETSSNAETDPKLSFPLPYRSVSHIAILLISLPYYSTHLATWFYGVESCHAVSPNSKTHFFLS